MKKVSFFLVKFGFGTWVGNDVGFLSFSDSKCCWLDTLQSKNTKLWSFSIKFDELIYNNVNNTFTKKGQMARQPSSLLLSANIVAEPCVVHSIYEVTLYVQRVQFYFINTMYNVIQLYEVNRAEITRFFQKKFLKLFAFWVTSQ